MKKLDKHYDVIVIGGGATGAGTARDCALRGLKVLLVERFDFTHGATGRNHGLLHSGARYAVTDRESATECIEENMILRRIAANCVEETGGLVITLPEDDLAYQQTFVEACQAAGIKAEAIDPALARQMEPAVNADIIGAVKVPDGSIDPFRLTMANVYDARLHGADILTYHEVTDYIRTGSRIEGVVMRNHRNGGEEVRATADVVVNAAGIWGHLLAEKAGVSVKMFPAKGSLLVFGHRVNNIVINRCRKPANADILVPGDTVCVIGTTSDRVPFDSVDRMEVTPEEVDVLLREGVKLAPGLATTRILRAYAGVRPLVASDDDPSGRSISRGIVCLDHASRDGLEGFITITGGKLMTYRLMAEWATDMVCRKLGRTNLKCVTAQRPLPGSESKKNKSLKTAGSKAARGRHGSLAVNIPSDSASDRALVCECENVSVGEIEYAVKDLHVDNLLNLRRRTRLGMGTCQGQLCVCRASAILEQHDGCTDRHLDDIASFVNERWKGIRPVAWGDAMAETQFTSWIYGAVCGLDNRMSVDEMV
ncbi:MAG: anaerobic glycerol-3-phosphate dehydrogenase subunit A [Muribaculaceae bacterium]|nr:anaerobic glycerol-3-phosphate dehydrogenase subunit A [Muribaculaceae bacterium]